MKPYLEGLFRSPLADYFTLGEKYPPKPAEIPHTEAFFTAGDFEPDPISLVDSVQSMTADRKQQLAVVDLFLNVAQVRRLIGPDSPTEKVVTAVNIMTSPVSSDSWKVNSGVSYHKRLGCMQRAHERMAALGIPRNG